MKKLGSSTFPKTQGILSNMQCDAIVSLVSHIIMGMRKLHFSTLWYGKKKIAPPSWTIRNKTQTNRD